MKYVYYIHYTKFLGKSFNTKPYGHAVSARLSMSYFFGCQAKFLFNLCVCVDQSVVVNHESNFAEIAMKDPDKKRELDLYS